mmetsp:Transcript_41824/g.55141  ORF Transcript_41824/g.55141 Transcript_41824/m.55141 type:complete len:130 (+) Transcript_41824:2088-2477(+)
MSMQEHSSEQQRIVGTRGSTREANNRSTRNELGNLSTIGTTEIRRLANIQDIMYKTQMMRSGAVPIRGQVDPCTLQISPHDVNANLRAANMLKDPNGNSVTNTSNLFTRRKPSTADPNAPGGGRQRRQI